MAKTKVTLFGKTVLVTGSPGFVGANLALRLLREMGSGTVISLDNMNDYYDPALKEYRLARIEEAAKESPVRHVFVKGSVADKALVDQVFSDYRPQVVVHLAACVRYSSSVGRRSPLGRRSPAKSENLWFAILLPFMEALWLTMTTSSEVMWISNSLPHRPASWAAFSEAMEFSLQPPASQFQKPRWATIAILPCCSTGGNRRDLGAGVVLAWLDVRLLVWVVVWIGAEQAGSSASAAASMMLRCFIALVILPTNLPKKNYICQIQKIIKFLLLILKKKNDHLC